MNEIEFSMALLFWVDDPIAQDLGCYKNEEAPDCVSFSSPSQDSAHLNALTARILLFSKGTEEAMEH
jgi:hypothetical protein